jgi:predicted secreted Zn-dependent protease
MRICVRIALVAACLAATPAQAWQAAEKIETYRVEGATGLELYRSIGERGPKAGPTRAIAYTTFDLKWSRDYREEGGGCRLAAVKPWLTIIYRWPQAPSDLPPDTAARWQRFIEGIRAHERVHGDIIIDMVKKIEAFSTGLSAENDPGCRQVRATLQKRLGELSNEQRQKSRDFDRDELSDGGNVHRLVLDLVN